VPGVRKNHKAGVGIEKVQLAGVVVYGKEAL